MDNKKSDIWRGEWWLPCEDNVQPLKIAGTLTYTENEKPQLELLLNSNTNPIFHVLMGMQPVIFGEDLTGEKYTVFNVYILYITSSSVVLRAEYFVKGAHIKSLDDKCILRATVNYANLKQWVLYKRLFIEETDEETKLTIKNNPPAGMLSAEIEEGVTWNLRSQLQCNPSESEWHIFQDTVFGIRSTQLLSVNDILQHTAEFSQFFSVAMLSKQAPTHIFLWIEDKAETNVKLLFKQEPSAGGFFWHKLIRYENLSERLPSMLRQWHSSYNKIAPICTYLTNSLESKSNFSAPDFLIVEQAVKGYFKRFHNNIKTSNGKGKTKLTDELQEMLNYFAGVEKTKSLQLDLEVLTQTRDHYTHLIPDGEKPKAIRDMNKLYSLTQNLKLLLVCCILDYLGLTSDEINECFANSLNLDLYI